MIIFVVELYLSEALKLVNYLVTLEIFLRSMKTLVFFAESHTALWRNLRFRKLSSFKI